MLCLGLMSGTSMDGIDAALLETNGTPSVLNEKGFFSLSYDPRFSLLLKATEFAIRTCKGNVNQAKLHFTSLMEEYFQAQHTLPDYALSYFNHPTQLRYEDIEYHSTLLHVQAVQALIAQSSLSSESIEMVGYHGQTLFHQPNMKCSIMLGDPQMLADQVGIPVVYDFRRQDIEAGGQGAPFAPLYHHALAIRDNYFPLAVVNCGGISNVTLIPNSNEMDILGFDTGPGNALLDSFVRQRTKGQCQMDKDGQWGQKGKVIENVIAALYEKAVIQNGQNYFSLNPPKSLDYGDLKLIPELDALSLEDGCATLAAFTADSIIKSVENADVSIPSHWILAGGGWHNPVIRETLKSKLTEKYGKNIKVMTASEAKWNNQALEAQIFAYLAVRSLQNKPLSLPRTTGVPLPLTGGTIFHPKDLKIRPKMDLQKSRIF